MFGPLVRFEMLRVSRRQRIHLWRSLYALALLLIIFIVYATFFPPDDYPLFSLSGNSIELREAASFGASVFGVFIVWQFVTIILVTPGITADCVAEEKDRKSIDFLLITTLSNREIVLGKLAARAAYLFMYLLAGVPILALLPLFGGIDPRVALASAVAAMALLLGILAVAAFFTVHCRNARSAVSYTYVAMALYGFVISGLSWFFVALYDLETWPSTSTWTSPVEMRDALEWISAGNPLAVVILMVHRVETGESLDALLPLYLGRFVAFYALVVVAFGVPAIRRLRTVAAIHAGGKIGKEAPVAQVPRLPPVTDEPVLWREMYCESFWPRTSRQRNAMYGLIMIGLMPIAWMLWEWLNDDRDLDKIVNGLLRGVGTIVALGIGLSASNQTVRALGKEKARLTYDSLVLTDLRAREILRQKWLGAYLSGRWALYWLGAVWFTSAVVGALHPLAIPLLFVATLIYGAFFVSLGLWCSVVMPTLKAASGRMGLILMLMVIGVGLVALVLGLTKEFRFPLYWSILTAPPVLLGMGAFFGEELYDLWRDNPGDLFGVVISMLVNLATYAFAAWQLWQAAANRFQKERGE